jgi:serine/threonine protein kinase
MLSTQLTQGATIRGAASSYRIEEQIGQGGASVVYKLTDLDSGRLYAAKVLSFHRFSLEALENRFQREILIQRQFHHPNVLPLREVIEDSSRRILVSPYAAFGSLYDKLAHVRQEGFHFDTPTAIRYMWFLARGLSYVHSHNVVHRDLTPRNVLFPAEDIPAIADFGIARYVEDATITGSAERLGSLIYISPEQREDSHDADKQDDVFSLGQLFYEIATGISPHGNPPPLAKVGAHIPRQVIALIESMRGFERALRPADATVVAVDLAVASLAADRDLEVADELPLSLIFLALENESSACQIAALETLMSRGLFNGTAMTDPRNSMEVNTASLIDAFSTYEDPLGLRQENDRDASRERSENFVACIHRVYRILPIEKEQSFVLSRATLTKNDSNRWRELAGACRVTLFRGGPWESWTGKIRDLAKSGVGVVTPIDEKVDTWSFLGLGSLERGKHAWLVDSRLCAALVKLYWGDSLIRCAYGDLDGCSVDQVCIEKEMQDALRAFLRLFEQAPVTGEWCPINASSIPDLLRHYDELRGDWNNRFPDD